MYQKRIFFSSFFLIHEFGVMRDSSVAINEFFHRNWSHTLWITINSFCVFLPELMNSLWLFFLFVFYIWTTPFMTCPFLQILVYVDYIRPKNIDEYCVSSEKYNNCGCQVKSLCRHCIMVHQSSGWENCHRQISCYLDCESHKAEHTYDSNVPNVFCWL